MPVFDIIHQRGDGGRLAPLEPDDLGSRRDDDGQSIILHALFPALQGGAACTKLAAELILEVLHHFGALEERW